MDLPMMLYPETRPFPPIGLPGNRSRAICFSFLAILAGCSGEGGGPSLELTGAEARSRLPEAIVGLVPTGAILCLDEERQGGDYHLWVLREPVGTWLDFSGPKRKGFEHHEMPRSALESILKSRLPSIPLGQPVEPRCRYSHWRAKDGAEIQVREIVSDQGWFASVERVRP